MTFPKLSAFVQGGQIIDLRATRSASVSSDEDKGGKGELGSLFKGMNKADQKKIFKKLLKMKGSNKNGKDSPVSHSSKRSNRSSLTINSPMRREFNMEKFPYQKENNVKNSEVIHEGDHESGKEEEEKESSS